MTAISVIVPTYNEKDNIPILLDKIHKSFQGVEYEAIIVDDNSPDGTAKYVNNLSYQYPVRCIVRKNERGLASAVVEGFKNAKGDIFIVMDADLQHPPEKIPSLIDEINKGADIVIANRYTGKDGLEEFSIIRKIISKGANYPAKILFRKLSEINDVQSGFFSLRKDVVKGIELKPVGYKILLEILVLGNYKNIKEVGYKFGKRESGDTKLGPKIIFEYIAHVMILARRTGELKRFLKYCTVGIIGIIVNTITLFLLTNIVGMFYISSSIIAHEISIIGNFIINDNWTFKSLVTKNGPYNVLYRAIKYNLAKITGIVISISLLFILTEFLSIGYIYSNIMAIMMGAIWGYSTSMIIVWKN